MTQRSPEEIVQIVRERYGEIARSPASSCCGPDPRAASERIGYSAEELDRLPQGANLGVGCGTPLLFASLRPGEVVLDLGSGAGMDAFLAAREVGENGRVIGVDMTPEMLDRARRNASTAGCRNVEFREGRLESLPVESDSVDAVISNCVINLVPDKAAVFREIARVLRPGGRMVISDVILEEPLPSAIADSIAALTGCIAGAALRADYLATIADAGLREIRIVRESSFGTVALDMVPPELRDKAEAAGIDVEKVADRIRSVTVFARK